eukprot:11338009-Karenia_brevis.AAC.1
MSKRLLDAHSSENHKLLEVMASHNAQDWAALGKFVARVRQTRRQTRRALESLARRMLVRSFATRKAAWKMRGGFACAHGVLFVRKPDHTCPCMRSDTHEDVWRDARWMACLDEH